MISDTTIRKLVDYISLNACSVNSSGLYNGKSGISLALFETAKCLQDTEIEDKAFSLFQESLIRKTNDYGFENGMSGIGYVLIYLITNKLIDADFEDLFGDQREAIIKHFENIDKQPDKLIVSYKIIFFLFVLDKLQKQDERIYSIIEKIFQGLELYLSLQFFDWKNVYYINSKDYVLQMYEAYLKLVDFCNYKYFSKSLMDSYVSLYSEGFNDVIRDHIRYGQKNINPAILFLDQKINLTGIIENADENRVKIQRIEMDLFEESLERIKRMVRPNCIHVGYQYGLARYLGFCANKKFPLL